LRGHRSIVATPGEEKEGKVLASDRLYKTATECVGIKKYLRVVRVRKQSEKGRKINEKGKQSTPHAENNYNNKDRERRS